jgi:hypothetical protein
VILASEGIYAANLMDIDAMGVPDPEHSCHVDDWGSNDGRTQSKAESYCPVWVFEDQASLRGVVIEILTRGRRGKKSRTAHKL